MIAFLGGFGLGVSFAVAVVACVCLRVLNRSGW